MRRIIIGDPHGRWGFVKQIYDKEQPDEVIILGDYFDSFDIDVYTQRESYEHIIELRKEHLKKYHRGFVMLIGNHDMHYMDEKFGRCSGWNALSASVAGYPLCRDWDREILQMCYIDEVNKTIYSHAGVSMNWFIKWCTSLGNINTLETKAFAFTYRDGGDAYGSSTYSSPLWLRPEGLQNSMYVDNDGVVWNQIFGHTQVDAPFHWKTNGADFYGIDCIWKHYLVEELDDNRKVTKRYLGDVMS
jgi:hypothetical protein